LETDTPSAFFPRRRFRGCVLLGAVAIAGVACAVLLHAPDWSREAALMAGIFVLAALLWMTEALPLFATALLVIGLEIVLLTNPGGWSGLGYSSSESPGYSKILAAAADPVLMLFFGSFLLARAAVKEGVDRAMSSLLLLRSAADQSWSCSG